MVFPLLSVILKLCSTRPQIPSATLRVCCGWHCRKAVGVALFSALFRSSDLHRFSVLRLLVQWCPKGSCCGFENACQLLHPASSAPLPGLSVWLSGGLCDPPGWASGGACALHTLLACCLEITSFPAFWPSAPWGSASSGGTDLSCSSAISGPCTARTLMLCQALHEMLVNGGLTSSVVRWWWLS